MSNDLIEAVAKALHNSGWDRDYWVAAAAEVIKAIEAAGFAIVPREPTDEMLSDADSAIPRFEPDAETKIRMMGVDGAKLAWDAMLAAAPKIGGDA